MEAVGYKPAPEQATEENTPVGELSAWNGTALETMSTFYRNTLHRTNPPSCGTTNPFNGNHSYPPPQSKSPHTFLRVEVMNFMPASRGHPEAEISLLKGLR